MSRRARALACLIAVLGAAPAPRAAQPAAAKPGSGPALEILRQLVAINTAPSGGPGQTRRAAEAMAARLRAAGFPAGDVRVLGLGKGDGNLVARLRRDGPHGPVLLGTPVARGDRMPPHRLAVGAMIRTGRIPPSPRTPGTRVRADAHT